MTKPSRRTEIEKIRLKGAIAARSGVPIHQCPYVLSDRMHWEQAYRMEIATMKNKTDFEMENRINSSTTVDELRECVLEIYRMCR